MFHQNYNYGKFISAPRMNSWKTLKFLENSWKTSIFLENSCKINSKYYKCSPCDMMTIIYIHYISIWFYPTFEPFRSQNIKSKSTFLTMKILGTAGRCSLSGSESVKWNMLKIRLGRSQWLEAESDNATFDVLTMLNVLP